MEVTITLTDEQVQAIAAQAARAGSSSTSDEDEGWNRYETCLGEVNEVLVKVGSEGVACEPGDVDRVAWAVLASTIELYAGVKQPEQPLSRQVSRLGTAIWASYRVRPISAPFDIAGCFSLAESHIAHRLQKSVGNMVGKVTTTISVR